MKLLTNSSLKTRLVASFAGVVILASLLSTLVFSIVLVSTMKKSSRDKIEETSKIALTHTNDIARGLEIYADLISSDMTFGQVLSFDSSVGIAQKIEEFTKLSHADVVGFIPRPEQYVQIKDQVFINSGNETLSPTLKAKASILSLLSPESLDSKKGWMMLGEHLFIYAMKPVSHFGANMGVVFLGRRCEESLAKEISTATGTEIAIFTPSKVLATTVAEFTPQPVAAKEGRKAELRENLNLGKQQFLSLFSPIQTDDGKQEASLVLLSSNEAIQNARNQTLQKVLWVAALAIFLSALIGFFLARAISNPLQLITNGIRSIMEKGDLSIRVPQSTSGGEIGILSNSFNGLLGQLHEAHEKLAASEKRMKLELTSASTVQEMLFPERSVQYGKLSLASFIDTSTETGGDWFGYGKDRLGENVTVLIGDVTGHGMPAALITAITNGFFTGVQEAEDAVRQALSEVQISKGSESYQEVMSMVGQKLKQERHLSTGNMLEILNQILLRSTKGNLMMTFFASTFDAEKMELRYANAGHNRPFHVRRTADKPKITVLPSDSSQRLGENIEVTFPENQFQLEQNDIVIWYTDGLLECENATGEMYGKRRFMNVLNRSFDKPPTHIVEDLIKDSYAFFGNTPRKDDITLVVGKIL